MGFSQGACMAAILSSLVGPLSSFKGELNRNELNDH
jgi:hypothetical protein